MEVMGARKKGAREGDTRAPFFFQAPATQANKRRREKQKILRSRGDKSNSWKSSMSPLPWPFSDSIFQNKLQCFSGFGQSRINPVFCYTLSFDRERRNTPCNTLIIIKEDSHSNHPRGDGIDCVPPKIGFCLTIFICNLRPPVLYL